MKLRFNCLGSDSFCWINKFYNMMFSTIYRLPAPKKTASIIEEPPVGGGISTQLRWN